MPHYIAGWKTIDDWRAFPEAFACSNGRVWSPRDIRGWAVSPGCRAKLSRHDSERADRRQYPLSGTPSRGARPDELGRLLKWVLAIDIEQCPQCGGPLTIVAALLDPIVMPRSSRILAYPSEHRLEISVEGCAEKVTN